MEILGNLNIERELIGFSDIDGAKSNGDVKDKDSKNKEVQFGYINVIKDPKDKNKIIKK